MAEVDVRGLRADYVRACAESPWGEAAAVAVLLGVEPIAGRREFARHVTRGGVHWDKVLKERCWSKYERWLIAATAGLWTGTPHGADVAALPKMGDEFLGAWEAIYAARMSGVVPGMEDRDG